MPSIDIQVLENVFSDEEKAEIIRRVTTAFGSVAGEEIEKGTSVRIHEVASGSWGWGGTILTTETAREMRKTD
jgi:4-oxalocrotonate tautomerase